jgi:hypothetical protein
MTLRILQQAVEERAVVRGATVDVTTAVGCVAGVENCEDVLVTLREGVEGVESVCFSGIWYLHEYSSHTNFMLSGLSVTYQV